MKIRKANKFDTKEMYQILNETIELRGFVGGEAYSQSWFKEVVNDDKNNISLVAEVDGKLAGFLIAHILADKDFFLNDIFVKPEFRNNKIATKLLEELNNRGIKIKSKFSFGFVLVKNDKMQNLFEKMNYNRGQSFYYYYKEAK